MNRLHIDINGKVQGVGFRPTVYRYAADANLSGFVMNSSTGVNIEVQGSKETAEGFLIRLKKHPPVQADIQRIDSYWMSPVDDSEGFSILDSSSRGEVSAGIPPDIAVCSECKQELLDPLDRRFGYPFINCTNCGPRFTIVKRLPYDREFTSMEGFKLCRECLKEYTDPEDRRFDAQPNACPVCGPELSLVSPAGTPVNGKPVKEAAGILLKGGIVAVKGLGGYHLSCSAYDEDAVNELRARKNREHKSLAVMFRSIEDIKEECLVTPDAEQLLESYAAPITVIEKKHRADIPETAAPDTNDLGVFLPYTPLHILLLKETGIPLVMTSCNNTDEPIISTEQEVMEVTGKTADYALVHNRDIVRKCDDSVISTGWGHRVVLRRSRGYVPDSITLMHDSGSILGLGAQMKNTFCLTRGESAFVSQHIGDLSGYRNLEFFKREISDLMNLFDIDPDILAYDSHPGYAYTGFIEDFCADTKVPVQHHHAHIAACMTENRVDSPVIGMALDGTGYGDDGTVWGGEFLVADLSTYKRAGHFKHYRMPGGDAAVINPVRMAVSSLLDAGVPEERLDLLKGVSGDEIRVFNRMIQRGINSPLTSSCGRIFDAVSAICGLCSSATYEGQAAVRLQQAAEKGVTQRYGYSVFKDNASYSLSFSEALVSVFEDVSLCKREVGVISSMFHNTVAEG
ncbi:MAG: carbamoyltransferase HypF, partial [Chitinivibrionales bacterium]